jgi:hypothetical protein
MDSKKKEDVGGTLDDKIDAIKRISKLQSELALAHIAGMKDLNSSDPKDAAKSRVVVSSLMDQLKTLTDEIDQNVKGVK